MGHVSICYHWASVVRPLLPFCILIFSSETTGPIGTKLGKIGGAWVVPFQNCIRWSRSQPRWPPLLRIENSTKKNHLKSFPLKLTWPIGTRLSWNGPGVAPFQNHIRWPRLPTKICFSPLTLPGEYFTWIMLLIWHRILQNQIFTLVAARPTFVYVVRCVVSTVLNTALGPLDLWFGWLVHFKVHYQKSQSKMFWVILCAYILIKDEILLTLSCPIFSHILIAKHLLTGSLKNRSIDNLETQKKSISMKNSQFFDYLLYAKSK